MTNQAEQLCFWPDLYPPREPPSSDERGFVTRWGEMYIKYEPPNRAVWTSRLGERQVRRAECPDLRRDDWFLFLDTETVPQAVCRHPAFFTIYCVGKDAARKWVCEGILPIGFTL